MVSIDREGEAGVDGVEGIKEEELLGRVEAKRDSMRQWVEGVS